MDATEQSNDTRMADLLLNGDAVCLAQRLLQPADSFVKAA
jgi:hypothetical protein